MAFMQEHLTAQTLFYQSVIRAGSHSSSDDITTPEDYLPSMLLRSD